jgi:hypothetical protein
VKIAPENSTALKFAEISGFGINLNPWRMFSENMSTHAGLATVGALLAHTGLRKRLNHKN